jgi:hypothetical protein
MRITNSVSLPLLTAGNFVEKEALPAEFFQSTDKFNNDFYQKTKKKKLF